MTVGKLFWKFFLAFWLALSTAGIGVGTVVWLRNQAAREQPPLRELKLAEPFIAAASATLAHGGVAALRELLQDWAGSRKPQVFAVAENGTELLGRSIAPEILSQAENARLRFPVHRITADDGHTYRLFAALPQPDRQNHTPQRRRVRPPPPPSPALQIGIGIVVSLIFSALLAWYFAKPIRNLRSAFDSAARGNLDIRVGASMGKRRDELADLGKDFDRMAGQIQRLMQAQQRLLHDVSHELRSPLARMQAAIGLAQQQPDKINPSLQRIERESQRMDCLVGELLTLSRLEAGVSGGIADDIDLEGLLTGIIDDVRFEAGRKAVGIEFSAGGNPAVRGQSELIRRACENVLRNAIQHSGSGATVFVTTRCDAAERRFYLLVADQGPGVDEKELAAIFEPFFRSQGLRRQQGTGLGLSIARRAIEAHGGKITAANRATGGLSIEISIPY